MLEISPLNPSRPVDWRWLRARAIAENTVTYSRRRDDPLIGRAWRFEQQRQACDLDNERAILSLESRFRDIFWAHHIYEAASPATQHVKAEIEARFVARQTAAELANLTGYSLATLRIYEQIFFNVLDRMHNTSFISSVVLGPRVHYGLQPDHDWPLIWKMYGWYGGPHVVDRLINVFHGEARPSTMAEVHAFFLESLTKVLAKNTAIAAFSIKPNGFTFTDFVNLVRQGETLKLQGNSGGGNALLESGVQTCIEGLQFNVYGIGKSSNPVHNDIVRQLDDAGIELPGNQLIAAASSNDVRFLDQYAGLDFPKKDGS